MQIQSVTRAMALMTFIADRDGGAAAKEAAFECGLALPTAYHLLNTLAQEGFLTKDPQRRYALGPKAGVLAEAYLRQEAPPAYLIEALEHAASRTGETVYVSAWRAAGMRVLARREGAQGVPVADAEPGSYEYAHARAGGKLLLAFAPAEVRDAYLAEHPLTARTPRTLVSETALRVELARIRSRGYATDLEEFAEGVSCLSVPVATSGVTIAALTVSAPSARFERDKQALLRALRAAAALE